MTERELKSTAIHEAGHAVAEVIVGRGVRKATIRPGDDNLGHVLSRRLPKSLFEAVEFGSPTPSQRAMIENRAVVLLAGPEAEARWRRRRNHVGASGDYEQVADWAMRMHGDEKVMTAWLRYVEARAHALVKGRWDQIESVAAALLDRQTLTGVEVLDAMHPGFARTVLPPVLPPQ